MLMLSLLLFRLPNTFRRLFAEGTFNAAFIPSYSDQKIKGKKLQRNLRMKFLSIISIFLIFLIIIVEIFTPFIIYIIAPGFYENSEKFNLAVEFTRITFPFLLFVTLSSLLSGILNTNNKFAAAAAAPIILNVVLILSLFLAYNNNLNIAKSLSIGVTLAGIFQFIVLIVVTRRFYFPSILFFYKI